jgi:hypothetical protein
MLCRTISLNIPPLSATLVRCCWLWLKSFNVISVRVVASRTPRCASSMIFDATGRVAGSSVKFSSNFSHTVSNVGHELSALGCPLCAKSRLTHCSKMNRYPITSSARARIVGGTVIPIALAVLRLRRSSKVVGCSTGRSAGFAPLRILSTNAPARRYKLGTFGP